MRSPTSSLKNRAPLLLLVLLLSFQTASAFYDPGLQRWINRDPIEESGGINLHEFLGENPICLTDPLGLSFTLIGDTNGDFSAACSYLAQDPGMKAVMEKLKKSQKDYTVVLNNNGKDQYDGRTRTIDWDPHGALRTTSGGRFSPAVALGHEMSHASAPPWFMGLLLNIPWPGQYDNLEELSVIKHRETPATKSLGEDSRRNHRGKIYPVPGPACR
jgi:hypothetical protein